MATYQIPQLESPLTAAKNEIYLVASGDLRFSASQTPAQAEMEEKIGATFATEGWWSSGPICVVT
jgi:hypothetical protein